MISGQRTHREAGLDLCDQPELPVGAGGKLGLKQLDVGCALDERVGDDVRDLRHRVQIAQILRRESAQDEFRIGEVEALVDAQTCALRDGPCNADARRFPVGLLDDTPEAALVHADRVTDAELLDDARERAFDLDPTSASPGSIWLGQSELHPPVYSPSLGQPVHAECARARPAEVHADPTTLAGLGLCPAHVCSHLPPGARVVVRAVDPGHVHAQVHEVAHEVIVLSRLSGQRRHDPHVPLWRRRPEHLVRVTCQELAATEERLPTREGRLIDLPLPRCPAQDCDVGIQILQHA
jgi:hypothetical protein